MGETPLVNCGPRSILLIEYNLLQYLFYCFLQTIIIHTIHLILCYSKPVRLTTSLFRWGKVLWLCCAGSTLAPESLVLRRTTSRRHQPSTCFLAPTGSIKPWFLTEGNLPLCASHLPLGVPNGRVNYTHQWVTSWEVLVLHPSFLRHAATFMVKLGRYFFCGHSCSAIGDGKRRWGWESGMCMVQNRGEKEREGQV